MTTVTLRTLGRLELTRNGEPVLVRRRKELALLAYLARRGPRPADRAFLASMLWGARGDDAKAKVSLRQALHDLREAIGDILITDQTTARIDSTRLELDLASFEADVTAGRLSDAVGRWQGTFLEGLEDLGDDNWVTWVESERTATRARLVSALKDLSDTAEAAADLVSAMGWAERLVEAAPHDEAAATRLIGLYRSAGRHADAQGAAAAFADRLRRDLEAEPTAAFRRLLEPDSLDSGAGRRLVRALLSPDLVGRAGPLATLTASWAAVTRGGRAVLIEGDEEIGKSRLLEAFAADLGASAAGSTVVLGRAFAAERTRRWSTLRPVLARAFAVGRGVTAAPPEALAAATVAVPELRERFPSLAPAPADADPGLALHRILTEMGAERPVAILIDDAPDADPDSAALLASLIRRPPMGLLLVLTGRPGAWATSPLADDLRELPNVVSRIRLDPIPAPDLAVLIGSMAPFEPAARAALAERVHRETGGVPGQAVQLVRQLADEGLIAPGPAGAWIVADPGAPLPLGIGLLERVRVRLDELGEPARRLIEAAALLGPVIDPRLLEAVTRLEAAAFQDALGDLLTRRLLREPAARPGAFEFANEATRRAIAGLMAPSHRARLHRAAATALARGRSSTPASAEAIAHHRRLGGDRRGRLIGVAIGLAVLAVAAVGATIARTRATARVSAGTPVLVATFRNTTGDAEFDGSLQTAAEIGLQQSGHVWILSQPRITDALQRSGRTRTDTVVDGELAREVAVRENVPVVIELGLTRPGGEYLITGRIVAAASGDLLRSFQARATSRERVLDGLSEVVANLRSALGEADSLRAGGTPLPAVTTRSLPALKLYADAEAAWNRREWGLASSQLRRALELDSTFAMAAVLLARHALVRANDRPGALALLAQARRWRSHLTSREQLALEIEEAFVTQQSRRHAELTELMAARFPTPVSIANHGYSLFRGGRCAEAIPVYRRAIAMAPRVPSYWINIASCYRSVDSSEQALVAYAEAERIDSTILVRDNLNHEWGGALVRLGRFAAAESAFRRMLTQPNVLDRGRGLRSLGALAMTRGDYLSARAHLAASIETFETVGSPLPTARSLTLAAQAEWSLGNRDRSRANLNRLPALLATNRLEPAYHVYIGLTHVRIGDLDGARVWLAKLGRVIGPAGTVDTVQYNLLAAAIAIAGRDYRHAERLLSRPIPTGIQFIEPVADDLRGRVHLALGRPDSALAAWRRARGRFSWGYEIGDELDRLPLAIADAALTVGDSAAARTALAELLSQWKDAPVDFPDRRRAREWFERLRPDGAQ